MKKFSVSAVVRKFPGKMGWHYVPIKETYEDFAMPRPKWGLIPATVTLGQTVWDTSLLPMGDGTLFIALKAKVRQTEGVVLGDAITLSYIIKKQHGKK